MDAYLRLSDTHIGYSVLTHNCDDENIANETQDEDDSEGDGDEKECEPPDHDLTLLIHPDLGSRSQYVAQNSRLSLCQFLQKLTPTSEVFSISIMSSSIIKTSSVDILVTYVMLKILRASD